VCVFETYLLIVREEQKFKIFENREKIWMKGRKRYRILEKI
jgi:hypothetical protein